MTAGGALQTAPPASRAATKGIALKLVIWLLIFMRDSPDTTNRDLGAG